MSNKKSNEILSFCMLVVLVLPTYILPTNIENLLKYKYLLSFIWAILIFFKCEYYQKKSLLPIWLFLGTGSISTILNYSLNNLKSFGVLFITIFSGVVITYYYIKLRKLQGIKDITILFAVFLIINAITRLSGGVEKLRTDMTGYSYYRTNYFLGIRVDISNILIFSVSLSHIMCLKSSKKFKSFALLGIIAGVYFVIVESVSTAIVTLLVYVLILIASKVIRSKKMWRNLAIFILICAIAFYFVSINMEIFSWLLEDFLGESLTFHGRTRLWEQALNGMQGWHWLFGNGMRNSVFTLNATFNVTTAHSQYLNILYYFGFAGLFAYVYMLVVQFSVIIKIKSARLRVLLIAADIAIIVMGIPTTTFNYAYMFIYYVCVVMMPKYYMQIY